MTNLLIKNVRVINPATGTDSKGDIIIRNGVIQPAGVPVEHLTEIDGSTLIACPGLWDAHVHFRDPGNARAETQISGAQSAAAGGFTHVVTMPNTVPAIDTPELIRAQIEADLPVKILPSACISAQRRGLELADLPALVHAGAVALTDDGAMLEDDDLMRKAMLQAKALNSLIMEHAVISSIAKRGIIRESATSQRYNLPVFPPEAEIEAVRRDIRLCHETGCPTHIQHISCAASVQLIRAAQCAGLPVSGEASPHHIAIAVEDIPGDDGNYRMNPPLGNRGDVRAIREGVLDNTLAIFATDHAPHTAETKTNGFARAAFGVAGLETAVGVSWKIMVEEERMPLMDWITRWTVAPAKLLNQPLPSLAAGSTADMVLIDPITPWTVDPDKFKSLSRNTPFTGWKLSARPVLTICGGKVSFKSL
ncbi:MAG: dihydroorotase [Kiritimatiellia bacterium]